MTDTPFLVRLTTEAQLYARRALAVGAEELPFWSLVVAEILDTVERRTTKGIVALCPHLRAQPARTPYIWVLSGDHRGRVVCPACRQTPAEDPDECGRCSSPLEPGTGHVIAGIYGQLLADGRLCVECRGLEPGGDAA